MAYTRIDWKNGEAGNTPLNANNLNRMDEAIAELDERAGDSEYNFDSLEARVTQAETNLNGKMNKNNPVGNGILTIDAINTQALTSMDVDTNDLEVSRISGKNGVIIATDDITVDGIPTPIGSLANTANTRSQEAETRANSAYNRASDAIGDAVIAMNRANENKAKIDLHAGLIGEGVGDKEPTLGYTDGYYIAPNGSVTQYNATAKLIMIDFLDFLFSGDNIIFNHVDLLPTENCIPCAWYDVSGNFISAADGLNVIAEIDEQTFKITKQYIDYCIIPVPAGASSCKMSGLANGIADIRIQTSLSEAIKDLQSKPEPVPLVLTNPSPLPCTDGKKILGIDAVGRSWQKTSQTLATVQGNMPTVEVGSAINQTLGTSTTRCVSNIVRLGNGSVLSVTSGFEMYVLYAESENGNIVTANGWLTSRTVTADGFYRIQIRKADNSAITPTSFTLTATSTPTPTSPIPIIDASEEVTAHTINLFDKSNSAYILDAYINTTSKVITGNANSKVVYIPCKPNTTYTVSKLVGSRFAVGCINKEPQLNYVADAISANASASSITFTTNADAKYLLAWVWYNDTVSADAMLASVQIEEGTTATAYVTYASNTITLPHTLRSVGTVADELIVNEDGSGKIVQRVGKGILTNVSQISYTKSAEYGDYATVNSITDAKVGGVSREELLCDRAINCTFEDRASASWLNTYRIYQNQRGVVIRPAKKTYASASEFFAEWNGATIYYILATPIETPLTAEQVASIRQLQTYKGTTVIDSEMQIDSVTYSGDVKGYVDGKTNYSYTDTIIGKWADGKDLHRMVIQTNTPSSSNMAVVASVLKSGDIDLKELKGSVSASATAKLPINITINDTNKCACWLDANGIYMQSSYTNKPCEIVVEYTLKDSAPAASVMSLSLDEETEE